MTTICPALFALCLRWNPNPSALSSASPHPLTTALFLSLLGNSALSASGLTFITD